MIIHVHDNNDPEPKKHNCVSETELKPGKVLTLHMHRGPCRPCSQGHCHRGTINLLMVDAALYVVLEGIPCPELITTDDTAPHGLKVH